MNNNNNNNNSNSDYIHNLVNSYTNSVRGQEAKRNFIKPALEKVFKDLGFGCHGDLHPLGNELNTHIFSFDEKNYFYLNVKFYKNMCSEDRLPLTISSRDVRVSKNGEGEIFDIEYHDRELAFTDMEIGVADVKGEYTNQSLERKVIEQIDKLIEQTYLY